MRKRRNAGRMSAVWDPDLLWYAMAVNVMKSRPMLDPTSWRYQAAVHDYTRVRDPYAVPNEALPSDADQARYWRQCQHGTWFFLPWHRAFVRYFERIAAAAIESLGGPADWALPFWDCSDPELGHDARKLPAAFLEPTLPSGEENPLFVPTPKRTAAANAGKPVGIPAHADTSVCLNMPTFTNIASIVRFGGGKTGFSHMGQVAGACELTPHGTIHDAIGGLNGWMTAGDTCALDPIFWLHHANIDRLWELWQRLDPTHTNPDQEQWRSGVKFNFHDERGNPVSNTPGQVVDLTDPFLDYDYEGLPSRPPKPATDHAFPVREGRAIPELVGATDGSVVLSGEPLTAILRLVPATGPALAAIQPDVHLVLEDVRAPKYPIESYRVYVNLRTATGEAGETDLAAGILPRYGVVESSRPNREHGGTGLSCSFEITRIVNVLKSRNHWDAAQMQVTFVPLRTPGDREGAPAAVTPVRVGRVSLYFS